MNRVRAKYVLLVIQIVFASGALTVSASVQCLKFAQHGSTFL